MAALKRGSSLSALLLAVCPMLASLMEIAQLRHPAYYNHIDVCRQLSDSIIHMAPANAQELLFRWFGAAKHPSTCP